MPRVPGEWPYRREASGKEWVGQTREGNKDLEEWGHLEKGIRTSRTKRQSKRTKKAAQRSALQIKRESGPITQSRGDMAVIQDRVDEMLSRAATWDLTLHVVQNDRSDVTDQFWSNTDWQTQPFGCGQKWMDSWLGTPLREFLTRGANSRNTTL